MSELQRIWSGGRAGPPIERIGAWPEFACKGSCFALVHDALPDAMTQGVEVVAGLFRFLCGPPATFESVAAECDRSGAICYCIDDEMVSCFIPLAAPVHACGLGEDWLCVQCADRAWHRPQVYEPFFGDFGPLNLGHTYNFCKRTNEFLEV